MSAAQQNRYAAMLRASGYEDSNALTLQSTDGDIPQGRELSLSWLAGTIMTGLTSVVLMGAALYVAFLGQDTFSTPYEALRVAISPDAGVNAPTVKTNRLIPVTKTRSEREIIEASIRVDDGGLSRIRKQPFDRIRATLATTATSLSSNIPEYDPVALLSRTRSQSATQDEVLISTNIYGAEVEGEITVQTASLPLDMVPARSISDQGAAEFVRLTLERSFSPFEISALGYAADVSSIVELGATNNVIAGVAENVTVMPKTNLAGDQVLGRSERILTIRTETPLSDLLARNGFTPSMVNDVLSALRNIYPSPVLPEGAHLRILFGPDRARQNLIPYRSSIYLGDKHTATVALTDSGRFVLGQPPAPIDFQDEDVEEINVNNLPTIYRSIWETARKYELDDQTIDRIVSLYAYDLDLTKRISAGDSIEILQSTPDENGDQELLYVSLTLNGSAKEFFRYKAADGEVDFFDPNGETGKRFLIRRPLEGGGTLRSRFGMRVHPIFKTRKLHSGVDLAAPRGTPVYASGDAVVKRAQWVSGYGRFVELQHANGYTTRYAHMNRIADGIVAGGTVRQGQIIGYVGTTGNSTGNHLHFEVRINSNPVDPLSIQLPRSKSLPARDQIQFAQTVDQIRGLMERDAAPVTVASN
ncbi:MAG TPA: M23 family metallopeptidase [Devosia sp.]|nr:M23 family metallopeptidase [Devosia sp.]